ncbi:MAG: glutamate racemase [Candidatus Levybacteria bacterium]|nr:glutamate racemase [Candidatus Levybacteria bacterium]
MQDRPIGVFDSGVGGLTILLELQKLLPNERFIYVADSAFAPYGKRSITELQTRTKSITEFLISKHAKIIVVACNTASISSIKVLRKQFKKPIIGVVPVVKYLSEYSKTKKVAILATPVTIKSIYLDLLISEFGKGLTIYKEGGTGLEELVEQGDLNNPKIKATLKKHLIPLKKQGIDALALGCTHYPFLKTQMEEILGPDIKVFDSGGAVARQTKRVLTVENFLSLEKLDKDWYYTTGDSSKFDGVVKQLTGVTIKSEHTRI